MAEAPRLELSRVSVRLGRRLALAEASFSARGGAVTAVVGPNGSGKTTLLRAAAGLVPYAGRVCLGGRELSELSTLERARRASYVPQRSLLNAALSVAEVVAQGRFCHHGGFRSLSAVDRAAVGRATREVDLVGYEARLFNALSGGEQRRVLLARALTTEADLLLLDEPTAALDVRHALELLGFLRELAAGGRSVVVVLHQLDDALRFADDVLVLDGGKVVGYGAASECLTPERIRTLYGVSAERNAGLRFDLPKTRETNDAAP